MYIKKAYLGNFGKFHQKTIHFEPGLNVVYGANESGKSTLHSFLVSMLFGMEKSRGRAAGTGNYQKYEPWNINSYYTGSLEFSVSDKNFTLERNFYHKEKSVRLYNQIDREELSVEHGDLDVLLGGISRRFYENTCCISQAAVLTEEDFADELQRQLMNQISGGEQNIDIVHAGRLLETKRKNAEQELKRLQREVQLQKERLEWEQGMITEDIRLLKEKLLRAKELEKDSAEQGKDFAKDDGITLQKNDEPGQQKKEGFLWKLPVIGWILRFIRAIVRKLMGKNSKKANPEEQTGDNRKSACETGESTDNHKAGESTDSHKAGESTDSHKVGAGRQTVCQILQEQITEKQMQLYNVQEEMEELSGVTGGEQNLQTEIKSIQLALETIQNVSEEGYQDSRDNLQASISRIFSGITHGKYEYVELTEKGKIILYEEGETKRSILNLSRGALEQLYFSIRLGTGQSLMQEEDLPILLDEPFGAYDDMRLRYTLEWLSKQKEQMILFTCQKRELELLEGLGAVYHRIML